MLSEHFSGVHDKASADAEGLLRRGSHLVLPGGWRNTFSIQRASERNVCERAMPPYFPRPQMNELKNRPHVPTHVPKPKEKTHEPLPRLTFPAQTDQKLRGQLLSEHFSGVHDKASADAEGLLCRGSHLVLPGGWRNTFSIQRASERNVCERAMPPYFPRPQMNELKNRPHVPSKLPNFKLARLVPPSHLPNPD